MNAPLKLGQPSILRREDRRLLTGRGRYADNTAPADALAVLFVRSPHAHARIAGIDKAAALASPGVAAIYTADDLLADKVGHLPAISEIKDAAGNRHREPAHLPMPAGKVRHVGDIVAMVVAGTLDQARDAAEALEIDYETLPAVVTVAQALAPDAPLVHDDVAGNLMCRWGKGDAAATDAAFARAAHVSTLVDPLAAPDRALHGDARGVVGLRRGGRPRHRHLRLAGRADPASPDVRARAEHAQGQAAAGDRGCRRRLRPEISDLCRIDPDRLGDAQARARPALDLRARRAGAERQPRPRSSWPAPSWRSMRRASSSALRVKAEANYGAYVSMFAPTIPTTGLAKVISGLYRIPAIRIDFDCAFTNTVPVDAIRGAGKPEALFLLERLVDLAAHETGRTPAELRRLNLLKADEMPYAAASGYTYDAADCVRLFETALQGRRRAGLRGAACSERSRGQAARPRPSPAICTAPAASPTSMSWSRSSPTGWWRASARRARARATRRCSPRSWRTSLGVPIDRIEIRQGDTRTIPHGGGTGGSSSTIISGTTLKRAADVVIQRGRDLAAERLETAPADIAYRDGSFEVVGTDRRIGLFELAANKPFAGDALFADKIESFPTGVMVCEVEVDPETGEVRVDRLTEVADCGVVVNPRLLAGQIHGGIVHGLGNALMEEAVYDEETGQLLSGTLMDYALPRADDVPIAPGRDHRHALAQQLPGPEGRRRAADQRRAGGDRQRRARCPAAARRAPSRHADHGPQGMAGASRTLALAGPRPPGSNSCSDREPRLTHAGARSRQRP